MSVTDQRKRTCASVTTGKRSEGEPRRTTPTVSAHQGVDTGCCLLGVAKVVEQKTTRKPTEARYGQRPYIIRGKRQDGYRSPNSYIQIVRHSPKKTKYFITMTVLMSLIIIIIIIIIHFSYCPAVLLVLKTVPVSLIKHFLFIVLPKIL